MRRHTPIILLLFITFTLLAAFASHAQDLEDNEYYQRALELQQEAEEAFARGDYDRAYERAEEAKENTAKAADLYRELVLKYRANTLLQQAENRINSLETLGVYEEDQATLDQAIEDFDVAKTSFNEGDYERSIEYSTMVLDALRDVQAMAYEEEGEEMVEAEPAEPTVTKVLVPEEGEEEVMMEEEAALPKYYTVRLIPGRRDCFWRIAEYEFVYGDPWKWRLLYEANKEKLADPNNPDLIHPGLLFEIPELEGEVREGEWSPED